MSSAPWLTAPRPLLRNSASPYLLLLPRNQKPGIPGAVDARRKKILYGNHLLRLHCSSDSDNNANEPPESQHSLQDQQGAAAADAGNNLRRSLSVKEILTKLRRYGISGVLSYGLLNTAYYLMTFLVVWIYVAPAPVKMGYFAFVKRFFKILAMVWAGSQVTKLARAGGALALAPFVDRGLAWFTAKFGFKSQGKAFMAVVGFCFALAVIVFLMVTLLWA
ncbi:uncharacterized protein LOC116027951 isoform X1 [Ipomoea triloba]|uniref:uncharacterized protein LOC116027951 isoform X1 n=1 Tax=Ipomoea triloba TaxID=35885 RepID=UPI00125E18BB|nr:uncharacterized protein LOC116027951 isoform X1 [Ipomoea triloba]